MDAVGKSAARAVEVVAVGFGAAAAAGVDVDADEYIRRPCVGRVDDAGVGRGLAVEVMALEEAHLAACRLQVFAAEGAVGQRQVAFAQGQGRIYAAGVRVTAKGVTGIEEYTHRVASFPVPYCTIKPSSVVSVR